MVKKSTGLKGLKPALYILLTVFIAFLWMPTAVLAGPCEDNARQLRGGFEVTQGRGGIWGYMEKVASLKKDSMLGLQIDGKLQRLVVGFESMCEDGKIPSKKTYDSISERLDQALAINNQNPSRTPGAKLLKQINTLNGNLDKILSTLGM